MRTTACALIIAASTLAFAACGKGESKPPDAGPPDAFVIPDAPLQLVQSLGQFTIYR